MILFPPRPRQPRHGRGRPSRPVRAEHPLEARVDGVLGLPPLLQQQEDGGVLHQGPEHKEDADDQVEVDGVQTRGDGGALPGNQGKTYYLDPRKK